MPAIMRKNIAAGTANALDGLKFQEIAPGGALVTLIATAAAAGGEVSFSVGTEDYLNAAQPNVEAAADVVDAERDKILDREPVVSGKMFLETAAQVINFLLIIEEV